MAPETRRGQDRTGSPLGSIMLAASPLLLPHGITYVHAAWTASAAGLWSPGLIYGGFGLCLAAAVLLAIIYNRFRHPRR